MENQLATQHSDCTSCEGRVQTIFKALKVNSEIKYGNLLDLLKQIWEDDKFRGLWLGILVK